MQPAACQSRLVATLSHSCDSRDVQVELDLEAQGVVLLQSAKVLRKPGVLVRVCEAALRKLPIVW